VIGTAAGDGNSHGLMDVNMNASKWCRIMVWNVLLSEEGLMG
jgi:hypothetical protein